MLSHFVQFWDITLESLSSSDNHHRLRANDITVVTMTSNIDEKTEIVTPSRSH